METLNIKYLAPYLPYGLKFTCGEYDDYELYSLSKDGFVLFEPISESYLDYDDVDDSVKPLLHPLSRLTEPVNHNGNQIDVLSELGLFKESVSKNSIVDFRTGYKIPYGWLEYDRVEILFSYHFDVFGLIEKGLAEPIKL